MKSELEGKIKLINQEIKDLNQIIRDVEDAVKNGKKVSGSMSRKAANARADKLELSKELLTLKHYKNFVLKLEEKNDVFKNDERDTNVDELFESLKKEKEDYSKIMKSVSGIKGNTVNDYVKELNKKVEKLSSQLAKAIIEKDSELVEEIKYDLLTTGEEIASLNDPAEEFYTKAIKEIDRVCKNKNMTKASKKKISDNIDGIIESRNAELGLVKDVEENLEEEKPNNLEKLNEEEKKQHPILKKIGAAALAVAIIVGGYSLAKNIKNSEKPVDEPEKIEMLYDEESLEYFTNTREIRESDAILLAENSKVIDDILDGAGVTDVKTQAIDELLADIYLGNNIVSSAENYDSLDTYCDISNRASVPVFGYLAGDPEYNTINAEELSSILDYAKYLDINDGSKFDSYMTELTDATANYYKNLNSDEAAQNLIDTIYRINKEDGKLTPTEEGIITEYILNVCGPLQVTRYNQKVTGRDSVTVTHLFDNIVKDIEVFESDCTYTRTLN